MYLYSIKYSVSFTISALVEILSCVALHPVLNRVGRKLPYFIAALCFAIIALLIMPIQHSIFQNRKGKFTSLFRFLWNSLYFQLWKLFSFFYIVAFFILNVLLKFFASGSYNIIYIYANELFPTRIRNTGMGICSMVARKNHFTFGTYL